MAALLGYAVLREHDYLRGVSYGSQTMCYGYDRAPLCERFERLLNKALALVVERARRLVENDYRRVLQKQARYRNALLLTAGELDSALADIGVVPLGQLLYKLMRPGSLGRRRDIFVFGSRAAVGYIFPDRAGEHIDILLNRAYIRAQGSESYVADIRAVE